MSDKVQRAWTGGAAIRPGIGVFIGQSGDNREHRHWAHQLSIGLQGPVEISSGGSRLRASALFIRAGTPHQLAASQVLSAYLDPTTALAQTLCLRLNDSAPVCKLPPPLAELFRANLNQTRTLDSGIAAIEAQLAIRNPMNADPRVRRVLDALLLGIREHSDNDRESLSKLIGLSESRFSHWFREQTGMPLRSYRKWLRLIYGLEQVLRGHNLTSAAHEARFADQAHFTRTFVNMFGVRPSDALADLRSI